LTTQTSHSQRRRGFLKSAAALGAASLTAGTSAQAAPVPGKKLKIGVVGAGEHSFMTYCWSDIIESEKEPNNAKLGTFGTPFLNMDITHVWDINPDAASQFAARMGAQAVKKYDDMVGKIDGIIFGGFYDVPWQHKLARPYVETGIPIYLSRPFAYCLRDIDEILEVAAEHNTPILATAKFEHYNEVPALKNKLKNVGTIRCVQATCAARDFPVHLHIQFMLPGILGYNIDQVSLIIDDVMRSSYLQETYIYSGWENQPPFPCVIHGASIPDSFTINIIGSQGTESATMVRSPHWRDSLLYRYAPQIIGMQRCFEGEMFEPLENIRKKTELFLTGFYSHLERGGAPVKVGTVPVDWRAPLVRPDWIDESIFKK